MAILSQAEMKISGVCRDYIGAIPLRDKERVQAISKDLELLFRFVVRVDGQPTWNAALTPYRGSNTVSPFIVLS